MVVSCGSGRRADGVRVSSGHIPDHLLYQILNTVPVWTGVSDLTNAGSICTRAGRFFLRMIFLTFLSVGGATSVLVVASATASFSLSDIAPDIWAAVWIV